MTSGRGSIHPRRRHRPVLTTSIHDVHHLVRRTHENLSCVLDVQALHLIFFYLQVCLFGVKKVHNLLHVDLQVAAFDREFNVLISFLNQIEQVIKHSRNEAAQFLVSPDAFHCERFATASLSVGEDRAIEAFKYTFDNRSCNLVEDIDLSAVRSKYGVKREVVCSNHIAHFAFWLAVNCYVGAVESDAACVVA